MEEKKSNGKAIASLILGIVALVFIFIGLSWLSLILSIVGLVLGVMARKSNPSGMATAGFVLNIIALVLSAIMFVACAACIGAVGSLSTL